MTEIIFMAVEFRFRQTRFSHSFSIFVFTPTQMPGRMPSRHLRAAVRPQVWLSERGQVLPHQWGLPVQRGLQGPQLPGPLLSPRPVRTHLWQVLPLQSWKHAQVPCFYSVQHSMGTEEGCVWITVQSFQLCTDRKNFFFFMQKKDAWSNFYLLNSQWSLLFGILDNNNVKISYPVFDKHIYFRNPCKKMRVYVYIFYLNSKYTVYICIKNIDTYIDIWTFLLSNIGIGPKSLVGSNFLVFALIITNNN